MVKNSEIQIAFLQFYRIFPPPSGILQHSLFIYYGAFWIYSSCSSAHEAVLWGVGRVGKTSLRQWPCQALPSPNQEARTHPPPRLWCCVVIMFWIFHFMASLESAPSFFFLFLWLYIRFYHLSEEDSTESLVSVLPFLLLFVGLLN